jgi:gamma-glutamylcyclotransferase (GGCT)/AIG2-like uncharacterized protein YtfP
MKKPTEKTPYVFVYGTLMSGFGNNKLLKDSRLVEVGTTEEEFTLVANSIPYLLDEEGKSYVSGEIYEVDESTLKSIDQLEGSPNWYARKIISVVTELGDKIQAWAYFMPKSKVSNAKVVESGSYREYMEAEVL